MSKEKIYFSCKKKSGCFILFPVPIYFSFLMSNFEISNHTTVNFGHVLTYYSNYYISNCLVVSRTVPSFQPTPLHPSLSKGNVYLYLRVIKNEKPESHFFGLAMEQNTLLYI